MDEEDFRDRFFGAFIGLVVGDALGTTLEFSPPGTFQPIEDMVGGGPFGLEPGGWTDDTSMAMCLAESLVARSGFDAADQLDRYRQWYRAGYWSCRDECFDIGNTVRQAIEQHEDSGEINAGSTSPDSAGNGSLMRLAPVVLYFSRSANLAVSMAAESSRTTHGAVACLDACRLAALLILDGLRGLPKDEILRARQGFGSREIGAVAAGSFKDRQPPEIRGTGYVVASLEAALWAYYSTGTFAEGALAAANLGDDADTTAAIFGQIAGAHYGLAGIPPAWEQRIAWRKQVFRLCEKLFLCRSSPT